MAIAHTATSRTATPPRLSVLDPNLPPALADIVERAIQKEPEARFADLGDMGRAVEAVRRGLGEEMQRLPAIASPKLAWRARAALRSQQWNVLAQSIEAMSESTRAEPEWRYWKARTLHQQGKTAEAQALLGPKQQRPLRGAPRWPRSVRHHHAGHGGRRAGEAAGAHLPP